MTQVLWTPSDVETQSSNLWRFLKQVEGRRDRAFDGYFDLWTWSVDHVDEFWIDLWDFADVIAESRGEIIVEAADDMVNARFFPQARLNLAENILRGRGEEAACVLWREDGLRHKTGWNALRASVSRAQQLLADLGVQPGDRVVAYIPNIPEALVFMLASVSLGAVWSSCSPDFGVQGTLDRIGQIEPKVLIGADGYFYGGKRFDLAASTEQIVAGIPTLEHVIIVDYLDHSSGPETLPASSVATLRYADAVSRYQARDVTYEQLPFDHPAFVLYTSGTTGKPKCIVHGAGRALLKLLKEHILHFDVKPGEPFFYFTTTGWNMWHTLVSSLGVGGVAVMFDGSPFQPHKSVLFDMVDEERIAHFGTSPKYLDILMREGVSPKETHRLDSLRTVLSTGSPLSPAGFRYVYDHIKSDVRLSSISGGTEIMSTLANGNPLGPVRCGELSVPTLGMKTEVYDEDGNAVVGKLGELVCTAPFPSRPLKFWNDPGDERYHGTYFSRYPNTWCHGDFAEVTEHGGFIIHGRSDATLNPGGIRIGTSDIYTPIEGLDVVADSIVVGHRADADEEVVLFVKLSPGTTLSAELEQTIRDAIREFATPRHVPAKIIQVDDIPYTVNGKKSELAVRDVVHGHPVKNRGSIANPASLDAFPQLTTS